MLSSVLSVPLLGVLGTALLVIGALVLVFVLWAILTYNALVRARNHCDESWAGVETELKRRYELIPNLVETVAGYARHEKETLDSVIESRNRALASQGSPAMQATDENRFLAALHRLFVLAEKYPELQASHNFLLLQEELATTENRIQRARRFYNANVRDLANRIETFPSNLVAGVYGFRPREYFEIEDAAGRAEPAIAF